MIEKINRNRSLGQNLTYSDVEELFQPSILKSYNVGEHLIELGDITKSVFFIKKGLVRLYKINDKGDEKTFDIRWENQFIASRDVLLFNKPSPFCCVAMEPTDLLQMNYDVLISRDPRLEALIKLVYQIIEQPLTRLDTFVYLSPEKRYLEYVHSYPSILNRIPDKYLAHVLGITPVSLSRIRKRLSKKR